MYDSKHRSVSSVMSDLLAAAKEAKRAATPNSWTRRVSSRKGRVESFNSDLIVLIYPTVPRTDVLGVRHSSFFVAVFVGYDSSWQSRNKQRRRRPLLRLLTLLTYLP